MLLSNNGRLANLAKLFNANFLEKSFLRRNYALPTNLTVGSLSVYLVNKIQFQLNLYLDYSD